MLRFLLIVRRVAFTRALQRRAGTHELVGCSRVFDIDIENCPNCGGTLKIIAFWVYKRICFRGQRGQVRKSSFMAKPEEMKVVMACFVGWIRYLDSI